MTRFREGDRVFVRSGFLGREKCGTIDRDFEARLGETVGVRVDGKTKPVEFLPARVRLQPEMRVGSFRQASAPSPRPPTPASSDLGVPPAASRSLLRGDDLSTGAAAVGGPAALLRPVPKPEPIARSSRYLSFVRAHACCTCGSRDDVEAHHWAPRGKKGIGQKPTDYRTVPLCHSCHDRFHTTGCLSHGPKEMTALGTRLFFMARQVDLLAEWATQLEHSIAIPKRRRA